MRTIAYSKGIVTVVLLGVSCLYFSPHFLTPGRVNCVDSVFPLDLDRYITISTTAWSPFGSYPNLERLMRAPTVICSYAVAKALNMGVKSYILLLLIGMHTLSGIGMYLLGEYVIKVYYGGSKLNDPIIAGLAALFYMFSPFSINRMWQIFFMPTIAVMPSITLLYLKFLRTRSNYFLVVWITILSVLGSTSPHGGVMILSLFTILLGIDLLFQPQARRKIILAGVGFYLLYLILSAYWIVPFVKASLASPVLPRYVGTSAFSQGVLTHYSKYSTMSLGVRLLSGAGVPARDQLPTSSLWIMASFGIPILAIGALMFRKNYVTFVCGSVLVISLFLATGTTPPLGKLYEALVFKLPFFSSNFGWILRDPSRWLFLTNVIYGILLCISFRKIVNGVLCSKTNRNRLAYSSIGMAVVATLAVTTTPIAVYYHNEVLNPVSEPKEYRQVLELLGDLVDGNQGILYHPLYRPAGYFPEWAGRHRIGPFFLWSLPDNINSFQWLFEERSWLWSLERDILGEWTYVEKEITNRELVYPKLATILNAQYIIVDESITVRKGRGFWDPAVLEPAIGKVMQLIADFNAIKLYKNPYETTKIWIPKLVVLAESSEEMIWLYLNKTVDPRNIAVIIDDEGQGISLESSSVPVVELWSLAQEVFRAKFDSLSPFQFSPPEERQAIEWNICNGSLEIRNWRHVRHGLAWFRGRPTEIPIGKPLLARTTMKFANVLWAHASIDGLDSLTGDWIQLIHCPGIQDGNSDWTVYEYAFLPDNVYDFLRCSLAGGWSADPRGPAITWFGEIGLWAINTDLLEETVQTTPPAEIRSVKRINLNTYEIQINAQQPFILAFAEAYSPLWIAEIRTATRHYTYKSTPLYGLINSFWLEQTGNYTVIIRFEPQRWFSYGVGATIFSSLVSGAFLVWGRNKRRNAGEIRG